MIGTAEFIYNRDVNGIYYINANLPAAQQRAPSPGGRTAARPRWTGATVSTTPPERQVTNTIVLKNQNVGRSWNFARRCRRRLPRRLTLKSAYSYGEAKNTVDPGSIASRVHDSNQQRAIRTTRRWRSRAIRPGHRFFLAGFVHASSISASARRPSRRSGRSAGRIGQRQLRVCRRHERRRRHGNDLIYIPRDPSEMNF